MLKALEAAEALAADGIEAEVIDLRTIMPLDLATVIASVRRTGRALVVTEAPRFGSVASEVAASIGETCFDVLDAAGHAAHRAPRPDRP